MNCKNILTICNELIVNYANSKVTHSDIYKKQDLLCPILLVMEQLIIFSTDLKTERL